MIIAITGTSKGIGRYLAESYLEDGHQVIGCSRRGSDLTHPNYSHYQVDVTKSEQIHLFAKEVRRQYGILDVLINNAGAASMNHCMMTPLDTVEWLMQINYLSAFFCIKEFFRLLRKSEHPRIVNFSTIAVPLKLDGEAAYASAKGAIEVMSKVMSGELEEYGITVNVIGPCAAYTDLTARVPDDKMEKVLQKQRIHRYAAFKDIKNVVDFYISPNSDMITGQTIYLGGVN